jgi:hypothetical protein
MHTEVGMPQCTQSPGRDASAGFNVLVSDSMGSLLISSFVQIMSSSGLWPLRLSS